MSAVGSVREAHPRRVRVGDSLFVVSLALDVRVASITRQGGARRLVLQDDKGELIGDLEPVRWRYLAPGATEPVELAEGDVLSAASGPPPPKAAREEEAQPRAAGSSLVRFATGLLIFVGLSILFVAITTWMICCSLWSWMLSIPMTTERVELQPGVPASVQVTVPADEVYTVWLMHQVETLPEEAWALEGTVVIDGLDFPVTLDAERPGLPGLEVRQLKRQSKEPPYVLTGATDLLGAILPEEAERVVTIEVDLSLTGATARKLELHIRN